MVSDRSQADLGALAGPVDQTISRLRNEGVVSRIWRGDPSVWGGTPGTPELADRLGWLDPFDATGEELQRGWSTIERAREEASRVVLLGMGGSSLAPEVIWNVLPRPARGRGRGPDFLMLDTTAPDALDIGPLDDTWFVVSSKSGSTLETRILFEHFWERSGGAADRFVLVTDPDSALHRTGQDRECAHVFLGQPDVGGRFSALTPFGLVPMAMCGHDPQVLIEGGRFMAGRAQEEIGTANAAAWLGAVLGTAANLGRNKLGLVLTPHMASAGLWLEQLIAESTGKAGKGILPAVLDDVPAADQLGEDWLVTGILDARDPVPPLDAVRRAGVPVVELTMSEPDHLGGMLFMWEFATAVAGAVMEVNPFDQPNVGEAKAITSSVLGGNAVDVTMGSAADVASLLDSVPPDGYVALLAYAAPSSDTDSRLASITRLLHAKLGRPVTWGYGPRYLHSTGQLHKGGPPQGVFVQWVDEQQTDNAVPGESWTFKDVFQAQADGDYSALASRSYPIVRVASLDDLP